MISVAALVLCSLAGPETISLEDYRDRLGALASAIDAGDLAAVQEKAAALGSLRVRHEGGDFAPDPGLWRPLAGAKDLAAARDRKGPLQALREALGTANSGPRPAPDLQRLERLRREEAERSAKQGGRVGGPSLHAPEVPPLPRSLLDLLEDLSRRLWEAIKSVGDRFFRWLFRLLFGGMAAGKSGEGLTTLVLGLMIGILGVVAVVAYLALQRRYRPSAVTGSPLPAAPGRDEDPLSRSSNEWEHFAAELMKGGRFREAIRAWYHAVLVTLFRSGQLHYRKDRTNWEYAYALGPEIPWRPGFLEATRTFELIWYGRRETPQETAEAYASDARGILERVRSGRHP